MVAVDAGLLISHSESLNHYQQIALWPAGLGNPVWGQIFFFDTDYDCGAQVVVVGRTDCDVVN